MLDINVNEKTISAGEIEKLQLKKINETIIYCKKNSPYYKNLLKDFSSVSSLDEFSKLPITTKDNLSDNSDLFLSVSDDEITDISTTSGSTGDPLICKLTNNDLLRLGYNEKLSFSCCGLEKKDVVLLAVTLDKNFIAGLAYFEGLRMIGASVMRIGATLPQMLLNMALAVKATAIVGVPSYLVKVYQYAVENNFPLEQLHIKKLVLIGESIRDKDMNLTPLGEKLQEQWGCQLFSTYGITELQTSFCECEAGRGGHVHSGLLYTEILSDDGRVLPPGEEGEVVVTTFDIEGVPLIRYRTGDISYLITEKCSCGRSTPRVGPIVGRKSQKLKIKGTTIYPKSAINVMDRFSSVLDYALIITSENSLADDLEIVYFSKDESSSIESTILEALRSELKIAPKLKKLSIEEISKLKSSVSNRKKTSIIDLR